jgi:hypothetical protein
MCDVQPVPASAGDEPGDRQRLALGVPNRVAVVAAALAAVVGAANASVSFYWATGGTALLRTIGGDLERWGREGGVGVIAALLLIGLLKLGVAVAAPVLAGVGAGWLPTWTSERAPRVLGWVAAVTLTTYGSVLTVAGLLVQARVIEPSADADTAALAWHAYFWDPWLALWGALMVVALRCSRGRASAGHAGRRHLRS